MSGSEHAFVGTTAIAGIGATEFSKESGRSELRLAVESVDLALRDAGIEPSEVDGLVGRYVTDWAGPGAVLTDVNIRLGAPNYPDDTMTLTGSVTAKDDTVDGEGRGAVEVTLRGANGLGDHVTGTVRMLLPAGGPR